MFLIVYQVPMTVATTALFGGVYLLFRIGHSNSMLLFMTLYNTCLYIGASSQHPQGVTSSPLKSTQLGMFKY